MKIRRYSEYTDSNFRYIIRSEFLILRLASLSVFCVDLLNLYLAVFQAVYRHWSELDVTFIFLGYVGL